MRIWFDTEFIDTGKEIHLISIGLVREDGQTYYAEPANAPLTIACDWVMLNVIPYMKGPVKPRQQIATEIVQFVGYRPEFWTYFGAFDWVCLLQLYGKMMDGPASWPHNAFDLVQLCHHLNTHSLPEQTTIKHNALNDAIWTRDAWFYVHAQQIGKQK